MTHNSNLASNEAGFVLIKEDHDNIQLVPAEAKLLIKPISKCKYLKKQTCEQELSWNGTANCVVKVEVEVDPMDLRQLDSFETLEESDIGALSTNERKLDKQDGSYEKHKATIKKKKLYPQSYDEYYLNIVNDNKHDIKKNVEIQDLHVTKYSNSPKFNSNTVELNQGSNVCVCCGIDERNLTLDETGRKVTCNLCSVKLNREECENNSVYPKYVCDICQYKFTKKNILRKHILQHNNIKKPYSCSFCPKKFSVSSTLKEHLKKHTGVKPYACTWCDRSFVRKSLLKLHLSVHTGEKPFSCTFCEFRCNIGYLLKRHLKKHTDGKPYSCTYCEYKCSQSRILKAHLKTHTGDKPFVCVYCQYSCSRSADLKIHLRTHTGEKPYSCTYCEYKCCRSDQLRRHVRVHTGEKAYSCPHCLYGCSRKRLLNQHLLKHTELLETSEVNEAALKVDKMTAEINEAILEVTSKLTK